MNKFGYIRLYRDNISRLHKLYFSLFGVSPDHKLRFLYLERALRRLAGQGRFGRVLDAGCGSGDYSFYFSTRFPDANITAVDIDEERISTNVKNARKAGRSNIRFECRDLTRITDKGTYDFVCCIDVLEHIPDTAGALAALYKAQKKGGYLYIHFPLKKERPVIFSKYLKDFHAWAEEEHEAEPLTAPQFVELVKSQGYEIVQQRPTFNHYLGELCVSLIMLFYKDTMKNALIKALLSPATSLLSYMDIALATRSGNAVSILARKA